MLPLRGGRRRWSPGDCKMGEPRQDASRDTDEDMHGLSDAGIRIYGSQVLVTVGSGQKTKNRG